MKYLIMLFLLAFLASGCTLGTGAIIDLDLSYDADIIKNIIKNKNFEYQPDTLTRWEFGEFTVKVKKMNPVNQYVFSTTEAIYNTTQDTLCLILPTPDPFILEEKSYQVELLTADKLTLSNDSERLSFVLAE